tara:strand:- start:28 stop:327 length:300 start_codon:yes stop_codon:yes gene_type:complete
MSMLSLKKMNTAQHVLLRWRKRRNPASRRKERDLLNELMASVVLLVNLVKQKVEGIEFDPEQQKEMLIVRGQRKSRSARILPALTRFLEKNGNAEGVNR